MKAEDVERGGTAIAIAPERICEIVQGCWLGIHDVLFKNSSHRVSTVPMGVFMHTTSPSLKACP